MVLTTEAAVRAAKLEKLRLFARLLKNFLTGVMVKDIDSFEELVNVVNDLSIREFNILMILREYEQKTGRLAAQASGPWEPSAWEALVDDIQRRVGIPKNEVRGTLTRLTRTGLCEAVAGTFLDYGGGHFQTTPNLDRLLNALRSVETLPH